MEALEIGFSHKHAMILIYEGFSNQSFSSMDVINHQKGNDGLRVRQKCDCWNETWRCLTSQS